jgi:cytidyltransferase-like protein
MRVYCDGVFDLFHRGHLEHLHEIRQMFPAPHIIVAGILSDKVATDYKRQPIFNEQQRSAVIGACIHVDEFFITNQLVTDYAFVKEHAIDHVVHAFNGAADYDKQREYYKDIIDRGIFIEMDYHTGISTTQIIREHDLTWDNIWVKKGVEEQSDDLYLLNGWDKTQFDPQAFIRQMSFVFGIKSSDSILEVGCGAGLLASYLSHCNYIGTDNSLPLVTQHIRLLQNCVLNFRSSDVVFKPKQFDIAFINSVLEYLPDMDDILKTVKELETVSKRGVYIGNILRGTHDAKLGKHVYAGTFQHLIVPEEFFKSLGYTIANSLYDSDRYDAWKHHM